MTLRKAVIVGLLVIVASMLAFGGCSDTKQGEEAKKRVLEKEDPAEAVPVETPAVEVDVAALPGKTAELEKVLLMSQEDIHRKLGSFRADGTLVYRTMRGQKDVKLTETNLLEQAANGDFYTKSSNSHSKSYELYLAGGETYDRFGATSFVKESPQGKARFWREKNFTAMNHFYKYFRGHLRFKEAESLRYQGRPAFKFAFELDPNGKTPDKDLETAFNYPNQYAISAIATDKMINKNRKRVSNFSEASGYVVVDEATGAPLSYRLHGTYAVPVGEKRYAKMVEAAKARGLDTDVQKEVVFVMDGTYDLSLIGRKVEVKAPEHKLPPKRTPPPASPAKLLPKSDLKPAADKPADKE